MIRKPKPTKTKKNVRLRATTRRAASPMVADTQYDDDLEPNMKLGRAFVVVLLLHVVTVAAIFAFNSLKSQRTPDPDLAGVSTEERAAPSELQPARTTLDENGREMPPVQPRAEDAMPGSSPDGASQQIDGSIVHTLRSGETITTLAKQYGVSENALITANDLQNVATLRVGMELTIPPVTRSAPVPDEVQQLLQPRGTTAAPAAAGKRSSGSSGLTSSGQTYTVQSGDNPYGIAREHGVSMDALLELNNIDDPRRLQIGQVLEIPAK